MFDPDNWMQRKHKDAEVVVFREFKVEVQVEVVNKSTSQSRLAQWSVQGIFNQTSHGHNFPLS